MLYRRALGKYIMEHSYNAVLNNIFWRLSEDKEKSSPKNTMWKKAEYKCGQGIGVEWVCSGSGHDI